MALAQKDPTTTISWKKLGEHYKEIRDVHLNHLFAEDPDRAHKFTHSWNKFLVDFSKQRITKETLELLVEFAREMKLSDAIERYFNGDTINETEGRAVLHTALRAKPGTKISIDGEDVSGEIADVRERVMDFADDVINGKFNGYTEEPFTDVVNIGIGGSDLGPVMATQALKFYSSHLRMHFVSNVDGDHVMETIQHLDPERTLFVIVSKSFGTQETLSNASTIKEWFLKRAPQDALEEHFVAVSSNIPAVVDFGIAKENIFPMWDWVGGRFSLWSAVGLSIALAIGPDKFSELLDGAEAMDRHFQETEFENNIPVLMALLSIWYNNFFGAETEAVIPYYQYLHRFAAYLQQAVMESNGKSIDRSGKRVGYETGTIVWGEPGTNSQHAYFQLIHQGTKLIPADFIGFKRSLHGNISHHQKLMANFFAQTQALMRGKSAAEVEKELRDAGNPEEKIKRLTPYKTFEGNRPTTTILVDQLTPFTLGSLIAIYEHKIFVQGVLWNIFSFDQWGVELGKQLASKILADMQGDKAEGLDSSTRNLLDNCP